MRTKVTLVLLFLNVALFFFIFRFEREWRTEQAALETRRRVLGPEAANIQSLEIAGTGREEIIRLERRGDSWHLTSPLEWPANPHGVLQIVNELKLLEHEASFAVADLARNDLSLADYGLDNPQLTVTFATGADENSGPPSMLRIGSASALGNRLYVLSPDGERVHVVSRSLLESLRLTPEELRAPTFFNIPFFEVRSLSIQSAAPAARRIRVRREEGDRWIIENPFIARASKTAVQLTVTSLNSLQPRTFLGTERGNPELAAKAGLGLSALRVMLEGNNRREILLLGSEIGPLPAVGNQPPEIEFHAKLENEFADRAPVFSVALPAPLVDTLRNAQVALRDRRVLDLENRVITAVTLEAPGLPELTLQRLESSANQLSNAWQILGQDVGSGPAIIPADRELVSRLLQRLQLLSAREDGGFVTEAPSRANLEDWGFTRPARRVTLSLSDAGTSPNSLTLELGIPVNGAEVVYAKLANQDSVYAVDPSILDAIPVVARSYRERLLRELPAVARITKLRLSSADGNTVFYERELAAGETWEQALAGESPERKIAVEQLRQQMRTLRARAFLQDSFSTTIPLGDQEIPWTYRLDTTISYVSGAAAEPRTSTLYFSERSGGTTQRAGSSELQGGVQFEIEQALIDALWTLTYSRRDPGPPAAPPPAEAPVPPVAPSAPSP